MRPPSLGELLDKTARTWFTLVMTQNETADAIYETADAIELAMEQNPNVADWSPSQVARKAKLADVRLVGETLRWMVAHQFLVSNGRGGCWQRFAPRR